MRRMNVIMSRDREDDVGTGAVAGSSKHECDSCRAEFPNKTSADRHMLFCRTLAGIRRGGGTGTGTGVSTTIHNGVAAAAVDDALMPTQREMFVLIQELAAKYNKVKDELDVMKQWAKMVGRRIGGAGVGSAGAGTGASALEFTSITRQKRQNMEATLNEEDDEMIASAAAIGAENPVQLRPSFTEWLSGSTILGDTDLNVVFNEDLVAGITAAILRVMAEYTAESGKSHLVPFKLADVKQGAFYIYDDPFKVGPVPDLPPPGHQPQTPQTRRWRAIEPCEFQLFVNTIHKLLFKEFKKWQDRNWDAQHQMTKQRAQAAASYHNVMSSLQCSPAAASCDGMYPMPGGGGGGGGATADEPDIVTDTMLSEDFATLYNKYADKMMGGALSNETILARVRAKLWKDMKAWRL